MIERQLVNGRDAVVAYLKNDWTPATADDAELVKISYLDDGSTLWLTPAPLPSTVDPRIESPPRDS